MGSRPAAVGIGGGRGHLNKICCWLLRERGVNGAEGGSLQKMRCVDHFRDIGASFVDLVKELKLLKPKQRREGLFYF